jgi:hypothetical protein
MTAITSNPIDVLWDKNGEAIKLIYGDEDETKIGIGDSVLVKNDNSSSILIINSITPFLPSTEKNFINKFTIEGNRIKLIDSEKEGRAWEVTDEIVKFSVSCIKYRFSR